MAIPTQSLLHLLVLLGKKNGGSRTIVILHATYRLTMRLVSTHISQWDVMFAGKWDSAFKGNSALRAHVARAAGIELAHREGQYVTPFFGTCGNFIGSSKAHLFIPQLVARGYRIRIFGREIPHSQITAMSPSGQWFQRRDHWLCSKHFGRLFPELFLGQGSAVRTGQISGVRDPWIGLRGAQ